MNHGFKLHPDGTLEITMPKGEKVGRVLVCEEGTQNGALYYSDGLMEQYKWERDIAISQLKDLGYELGEKPRKSDVGDMISRKDAIDAAINAVDELMEAVIQCHKNMPSPEPERKKGKQVPSNVPELTLCKCDQCVFNCGAYSYCFYLNCGTDMRGTGDNSDEQI